MIRDFSPQDKLRWERLTEAFRQNDRILYLYSRYLNLRPDLLDAKTVTEFAESLGMTDEEAFRSLFAAACGLDSAENAEDRHMEQLYVGKGVSALDPVPYRNDAYVQTVRFPELTFGKWSFGRSVYQPYEAFVAGNPILTPDGREIPRIGFFREPFNFPAVSEEKTEWMAVKPNEIETMKEPIREACGNVVTLGLGLGYFAFHASNKENVSEVTVVERDPMLVSLFRKHLLPQFPHREKLRFITTDAFDYLEKLLPVSRVDFLFADLWHDQSDGFPMYLRIKKAEQRNPGVRFSYWIEPVLLSTLRRMVFDGLRAGEEAVPVNCFEDVVKLLSDESLKALAPTLKLQA